MLSLVSMFACALIRWGILAGVLYIRRRRVGLHPAVLLSCVRVLFYLLSTVIDYLARQSVSFNPLLSCPLCHFEVFITLRPKVRT